MSTAIKPPSNASLISRVAFTPISELLRGRIAPIPTIESVIAAASLAPPISELINRVVVKTRLWKREQLEVVRELISHFNEGREFGTSVEELVKDFGHPATAAKLIRRSKKRNRSLIYRSTVRASQIFGLFVAIILFTYGVFAFRVFCYSPTLSMNYVADYNARVSAIPQMDRTWPLYRKAALVHGPWPDLSHVSRDINPNSPDWPKCVEYATAHQEAAELFRQAASRPQLGRLLTNQSDRELDRLNPDTSYQQPEGPVLENPPLISVYLPELQLLRGGCRLLEIDAYTAAQSGNSSRFLDDVKAMFGMIEHIGESHNVISDLCSFSILSEICDLVKYVLRVQPDLLNDSACIGLAHQVAGVCGGRPLRIHFDSERQFFSDILQRTYSDDGHGDGHLIWPDETVTSDPVIFVLGNNAEARFLLPMMSFLNAGRQNNLRKYDEMLSLAQDQAETPLWKRGESAADRLEVELHRGFLGRFRYLYLHIFLSSFSRSNYLAEVATQERDATLTVIALELYKRKTGAYPDSLSQLVPQFMPAMPLDRFDGQPLKYKVVNGAPLLYSVGADRHDDSGQLPQIKSNGKSKRVANRAAMNWAPPADKVTEAIKTNLISTGDWILWPPVD